MSKFQDERRNEGAAVGFTIEEARAGHALVEREVAAAEAALAAASGRHERRLAEENLDSARARLATSSRALESLAKQLGVSASVPAVPAPAVPGPRQPGYETLIPALAGEPGELRLADKMLMSDAIRTLRSFGEKRVRQGDEFLESEYLEGKFFYATGDARTGISVWGEEDDWVVSVFSAARVKVRPTLALYQYISRWRTTDGAGAPYVVQGDDGYAAIMCERIFTGSQFACDVTGWRMIHSTIDLVAEAAQNIALVLAGIDDGGRPFTGEGHGGLMALLSWWEISDESIKDAIRVRGVGAARVVALHSPAAM